MTNYGKKRERQIWHKYTWRCYIWREYTDTPQCTYSLAFIIEISSNNSIHSSLIHLMSNIYFQLNALHTSSPSLKDIKCALHYMWYIYFHFSMPFFFSLQYWLIEGSVIGGLGMKYNWERKFLYFLCKHNFPLHSHPKW